MRLAPFSRPGRFWRGNLHTHCDRSDGALTAEQVVDAYKRMGYDFLQLSDHFLERFDAHVPRLCHPGQLEPGIFQADMGIKAAAGGRHGVRRDGIVFLQAVLGAILGDALLDGIMEFL